MIVGDYQIDTIKSGRWKQNCYLIQHLPSSHLLLIDPGGEENQIVKAIENTGRDLSLILLTHAHFDHVGALKPICDQFDLPFFMHEADRRLLRQAPLYGASFEKIEIQVPDNQRFLSGDEIEWKGTHIKFFHAPGHTPGGVCYYWHGIAFTGDVLLHKQTVRTDLPGADSEVLNNTITQLLELLPKDTLMFPGHGSPWFVRDARKWWESHSESPPEFEEEIEKS